MPVRCMCAHVHGLLVAFDEAQPTTIVSFNDEHPSSYDTETLARVFGVLDALADNYVLSACRAIIPREIGASTFHDAAVARAAFGFAWPRNETLAYHAQPPRDPIFGPAHCDS